MRMWYSVIAAALAAAPAVAAPTFNKDVAPILWKQCASCHRNGEVGPFPLLTYKDAAKRAEFIVKITQSKRMPPWPPEPEFGSFHDERRLSKEELKTLADWAEAGAPEGNAADLPAMSKFPEGWQLGEPDLVLKMPRAFTIPAEGRDVQQCFVLPMGLDVDKTVSAVDFRPGNRKVVHHAIFYLDHNGIARLKEKESKDVGFRTFGGPGFMPTGGLGAWAPGSTPRFLDEGMGKYVQKGSDLVMQIHYHASGKEETDLSSIGIYFTKKPVTKYLGGVALINQRISIPAGEKDFKLAGKTEPLPVDVQAVSVFPHMHLIGKEMKTYAVAPDGKEIPLIWIKDWDFNWQGSYYFKEPVKLPKGSVIKFEARYDNSVDNPRNPSNPPQRVTWGEQTTNEMGICGLQVITETPADMRAVMKMRNHMLALILGSAPPPDAADVITFPAEGIIIPQAIKERMPDLIKQIDKDGDGKLSKEEFDALSPALQSLILQRLPELKKAAPKK